MAIRLLPAALVLAALVAEARDLHGLASYLLVAGVPAAAVSALVLFGRLAELSGGARGQAYIRFETSLASLGLVLVLVAAAARGQAAEAAGLTGLTASAIVAALSLYVVQTFTSLLAPGPRAPSRAAADVTA